MYPQMMPVPYPMMVYPAPAPMAWPMTKKKRRKKRKKDKKVILRISSKVKYLVSLVLLYAACTIFALDMTEKGERNCFLGAIVL